MIIKCKMCGGDIDFIPGATYGTCEYCGSTSTIPQAEDENKLNRYNRANHFRRQCEFDKAVAAYEKILEQDDTDAEAHWGAVISRFGIEYVEDPATHQRIPTCHRVQVASILTDEDYLAAVENAPDEESRRIYQEEAARIAEIQKGILAISANEKPYDVFICYKETDENGQRTRDSQWAQDVYYGLTEQGLKVFFSRITLEDKLGQQYEPYIFAALNSAKVMVVIGSRPEYFNAVWVKNEWSRYLSLMKHDHKRLLIPCYRDMDPYDLPEELSMLQSQDMSKIGFMQDLLRGVQKVMQQPTSAPQVVRVETATVETNAPGVTSLLKRAALFLEDGDTASAREYYDRVLDIDPECAEAYMGKVCAETGCRKESDLGALNYCVDMRGDWQKAVRFASAGQKQKYEGYMASVRARVEEHCHELAIDCACAVAVGRGSRAKMDEALKSYRANCLTEGSESTDYSAEEGASWHLAGYQSIRNTLAQMAADGDPRDVTEGMLKVAAAMFGQIKGEEARAQQCLALAEQARLKAIYEKASARREAIGMPDLMDAAYLEALAKQFGQIPGYKDAKQQAEQCLQDAENVRENAYNDAVKAMQEAERSSYKWREAIQKLAREGLNGYRDVEELRKQAEQRYEECRNAEEKERKAKERRKKTLTIAAVVLVVIACAIAWCIPNVIIPNNKYQQAVVLRENGQYDEAIALFTELGNYYDAAAQVTETKYQKATNLNAFGKYDEAYAIYVTLTGYKDVDKLLIEDDNIVAAKKVLEAREAQFTVGNYVTFGEYPQTTAGEDMTPIEWLVLARDGNKALLISRYGLDAQPYNTDHTSVTWETCTLRTWLNVTFYNKAFSSDEQAAILTTSVDNGKNQGYSKWSTSGGNNTEDKVFLLSYAEANKYFGVTYDNISNTKSRVAPTAYAIAQGAWASSSNKTADSTDAGWWWLRSPGFYQSSAAYVLGYGLFRGDDVIRVSGSVRPALWVNLESDVFSY
jgi:tetratricopeptide (TPR) repeat protein